MPCSESYTEGKKKKKGCASARQEVEEVHVDDCVEDLQSPYLQQMTAV